MRILPGISDDNSTVFELSNGTESEQLVSVWLTVTSTVSDTIVDLVEVAEWVMVFGKFSNLLTFIVDTTVSDLAKYNKKVKQTM